MTTFFFFNYQNCWIVLKSTSGILQVGMLEIMDTEQDSSWQLGDYVSPVPDPQTLDVDTLAIN